MTDVGGEHEPGWTEQRWSDWTDYADRVRVEVRFKEWAGSPDLDEVWVLRADGAAWSYNWIADQLQQIASDGGGGCCGGGTFMLDVHERHTEWGASSATWEAILTLSQSLLNNTAWVGLGVLADTMRRRLAERPGQWADSEAALVDQDVRGAALETVAKLRAQPVEHLAVRSTEAIGKDTTTLEVEDPTGAVFRVEVIDRRGVVMAKVRKITESNPD